MFVLSNLVKALAYILNSVLEILFWIILIRALISWVNPDPYNPIVRFLDTVTEPILSPIRRVVPPIGLDFSPLIAILVIKFIQIFLVGSLMDLSVAMR